jgi:hypothetical protein
MLRKKNSSGLKYTKNINEPYFQEYDWLGFYIISIGKRLIFSFDNSIDAKDTYFTTNARYTA